MDLDIADILTTDMLHAAACLNTGGIIFVQEEMGTIRMETENGTHPYFWTQGRWLGGVH